MDTCRCGEVKPRDQSSCGRPACLIAEAATGERWDALRDERTWRHKALYGWIKDNKQVRVDRFAETQIKVHATRRTIRKRLHHAAVGAAYERMRREDGV